MRLIKLTVLLTLSFLTFAYANSKLDELKTKAESGDVKAQYELGSNYRLNQRDKAGRLEAEKWLRMAAEEGHARAQFELGYLYDPEDAGSIILIGLRYRQIIDSISQLYLKSESDSIEFKSVKQAIYDSLLIYMDAEKWYLKAAEQNLAEAQSSLASLYFFGWGDGGNKDAFYWFEKAAMQNDLYAQSMLLESYASPLPCLENLVRAHFWLKISIENNSKFLERYRVTLSDLEERMTAEQLQEAKLLLKKEKDQILNQNSK